MSHEKTRYISKMQAFNFLPAGTTLDSKDFTSLYTNIPHRNHIEACTEVWDSQLAKSPSNKFVTEVQQLQWRISFTNKG